MKHGRRRAGEAAFWGLLVLALLFLAPIAVVLMNSFKGQFYISDAPFSPPDASTWAGLENYKNGIEKTGFLSAFGYSLFITVCSVAVIVLFCSMAAWNLRCRRSGFQGTVS